MRSCEMVGPLQTSVRLNVIGDWRNGHDRWPAWPLSRRTLLVPGHAFRIGDLHRPQLLPEGLWLRLQTAETPARSKRRGYSEAFPEVPSAMALRSRFWALSVCRNPEFGFAALSTSSKSAVKPEVANEAVASEFTNRNPRNLELLAVARKERGWGTVWPSREFWHRLRVIRTQHHIEAFVEHLNGQIVVSASTYQTTTKCYDRRWCGATGTAENLSIK
ncbi:large ribosomal subunit protein uL18m isoform 2-T2 [Trichechus inunguis]